MQNSDSNLLRYLPMLATPAYFPLGAPWRVLKLLSLRHLHAGLVLANLRPG
jgi:hypothetical protein